MSDPIDDLFRDLASRRRRSRPSEGGRGDGPRVVGPKEGGGRRRYAGGAMLVIVVVAVIVLLTLGGAAVNLATDAMWYGSVGYSSVFWTRVGTQLILFVATLVVVLVWLLVNLRLAVRFAPPPAPGGAGTLRGFVTRLSEASRYGSGGGFGADADVLEELPDLTPIATWVLVGITVLIALGIAGAVANAWDTVALWVHRVPYSPTPGTTVADPIFGLDISFFLFELPFWRLVQSVLSNLVVVTLLVVVARHAVGLLRGRLDLSLPARLHLGILGGLLLVSFAAGYQLDRFELVYSTRGVASGVSYTDQSAQFTALQILTIVALIVAVVVVAGAYLRRAVPVGLALGAWLVVAVVLGGIYPEVIQRFTVQPNEFAQESPYIANNIRMTRLAFALDSWSDTPYAGTGQLTQADVDSEQGTFENARLWDYRPLGSTLDQLQTVRQYYDFVDVDTDRYTLDGRPRQVMLSAREIAPEKNPQAQTWVNQRITYTHGFGLAMVPVSEVTPEGLPDLIIRDMPPASTGGAPKVTEPRIYFGERASDYVVVDARQPEFDYPIGGSDTGESTAKTSWTGTTGIRLDSPLTRLLFSLRFRDLNLLISDQLTSDSQLLFNRSLGDRLPLIAPFLRFDSDPYLVVTDSGRLVYIQDAYTVSDRFPNAQPFDAASNLRTAAGLGKGGPFDYVRNSVKIVMDAYDGTTTLYAADESDPILRDWRGVFPDLVKPIGEMPAGLRSHLRVPEELFDTQTRVFATYHVTDPQTFYQQQDLWTVPAQPANAQQLPLEAYYVYMRLPGQSNPEFLLLQPMVPTSRPNMIAWIAARNDQGSYGQVDVFRFPRDTSIFGPTQIEARIDNDPIISAQITLWNQSGSTVVRGNLIVVPVQDTLIYLEPVYLQSTSSQFPEFQRVVVASSTRVAWGSSLGQALTLLLAGGPSPGPTPTPGPGASPGPSATPIPQPTGPAASPPADLRALIAYANEHYDLAQQALREGDFARYGTEIALVKQALGQMSVLVGGSPAPEASPAAPAASPAPSASPAP
jgi:hypothetical protein